MRLATFNVENMFERPAAMNMATWADGRKILEDYSALCNLAVPGISAKLSPHQIGSPSALDIGAKL